MDFKKKANTKLREELDPDAAERIKRIGIEAAQFRVPPGNKMIMSCSVVNRQQPISACQFSLWKFSGGNTEVVPKECSRALDSNKCPWRYMSKLDENYFSSTQKTVSPPRSVMEQIERLGFKDGKK